MGVLGKHYALPGDYHSLSLTRIQFHPLKVAPLTNLEKVTIRGDSATVTLPPGDSTTAIKVKSAA